MLDTIYEEEAIFKSKFERQNPKGALIKFVIFINNNIIIFPIARGLTPPLWDG